MQPQQYSSEMLMRLREFHAQDPSELFARSLLRRMEDPLVPRTKGGKLHLNPILLLLLVLGGLAGATFAIFNLVQ